MKSKWSMGGKAMDTRKIELDGKTAVQLMTHLMSLTNVDFGLCYVNGRKMSDKKVCDLVFSEVSSHLKDAPGGFKCDGKYIAVLTPYEGCLEELTNVHNVDDVKYFIDVVCPKLDAWIANCFIKDIHAIAEAQKKATDR